MKVKPGACKISVMLFSSSGVGNSFDMESEFLRQGGASFGTGTALRYLAANYIKTGRDLPGLEVPGARCV